MFRVDGLLPTRSPRPVDSLAIWQQSHTKSRTSCREVVSATKILSASVCFAHRQGWFFDVFQDKATARGQDGIPVARATGPGSWDAGPCKTTFAHTRLKWDTQRGCSGSPNCPEADVDVHQLKGPYDKKFIVFPKGVPPLILEKSFSTQICKHGRVM